jgi:hypothetical protein
VTDTGTDTGWYINSQYESGDETVFKCHRHHNGEHLFSTVRVLTSWWRIQGSVADVLRKAERNYQEEQKS